MHSKYGDLEVGQIQIQELQSELSESGIKKKRKNNKEPQKLNEKENEKGKEKEKEKDEGKMKEEQELIIKYYGLVTKDKDPTNIQLRINEYCQKEGIYFNSQIRKKIKQYASRQKNTWSSKIKKIIPNQQNKTINQLYQPGQFSKFAVATQNQLFQTDDVIQKVIREAVYSYEKKIEQNYKQLKQFMPEQSHQKQLVQLFGSHTFLKKFIEDPQGTSIQQILLKDYISLDQQTRKYTERKMLLKKSASVDGKYLKLAQLKIYQRFYSGRHLYIPVQNSNLFIKLNPENSPTRVMFKNGKFFDQKQISLVGDSAKEEIMAMVILFLKNKKILVEDTNLNDINTQIIKLIGEIKNKNN